MNKKLISALAVVFLSLGFASAQPQQQREAPRFHGPFIENFSHQTPDFFNLNAKRNGAYDYRYYPGMPSLSEKGTEVMVFRIDPNDPAGAGRGPEMVSKELTHFGTYSARLRVPDVKEVQPNVGIVVGCFTYRMDPVFGLSEIDWEWLIADPEIVYIGAWTGGRGGLQRVGRTINLAKGEIYNTIYRCDDPARRDQRGAFDGEQNQPEVIAPIEGYDASKQFYTYGFDWYPEHLTWWIIHPVTNEKIILWDYVGKEVFPGQPARTGVPVSPTHYLLNFWHTNNWPVETNPASTEKPKYPYALEVDWMSYRPYDEINKAWQEENGQK